jgi:hypothetical protein
LASNCLCIALVELYQYLSNQAHHSLENPEKPRYVKYMYYANALDDKTVEVLNNDCSNLNIEAIHFIFSSFLIFIVFPLLSIAHSFLLLVLNSQSSCRMLYADE